MGYLDDLDPANLTNVVRQLAIDVAELKGRTVNAQTLDEFTNDMGLQTAGEFRSGNGAEPGDGFTGGRYGFPGFEYNGALWFFVGVNNDRMMVGIDLETGKLLAAGGAMTIDDTGITMEGLRYALQLSAKLYRSDPEEAELAMRIFGRAEMTCSEGSLYPSLTLTSRGAVYGVELLGANRGFELGDLTDWTDESGSDWSVVDSPVYEGSYAALCSTSDSATLKSKEGAISTPGAGGEAFQIALKIVSGRAAVFVNWLDGAGGNLLREDLISGYQEAGEYVFHDVVFIHPPEATHVQMVIVADADEETGLCEVYVDSSSIRYTSSAHKLFMGSFSGLFYANNSGTKRVFTGKQSWHTPRPPIAELITTSSGNVDAGTHLYKAVYVDYVNGTGVDGKTLASAASNSVTNDATHKKNKIILPIRATGATEIYRTKAGGSIYYFLGMVSNGTLVYIDNVADASLPATTLPTWCSNDDNPIFPSSTKITGGQFLKYPDIAYGWLAIAGYAMGGVAVDSGMGMQYDTYKTGFLIKSGSYKLILHLGKAPNAGIVDIYLDGVLVQAAVDLYAAASVAYVLTSGTQTIGEDGWHELELVVVGKNASSTGYDVRISMVEIAPVSTLTTYRSQPDETDGIDSYIRQSLATTNFGTETTMLIGWGSSTSTILRGLLKFDLSKGTNPPPAGAIVVGTPRMKLNCTSFTTAKTLAAYASFRDWVEAQVTWNIFSTGNNWQTAGAAGALDYDPTLLGSVEVSASGYIIMPLPVSLVQGWIDVANYGLILRHTVETTNFNQYATASHATAAFRPELLFEWR